VNGAEAEVRVLVPEYGVLAPVTIPGGAGAVAVAAGLSTSNPLALGLGIVLVAGGVVVGGAYAAGRVLNDWPRRVDSGRAAVEILADNRPSRADLARGLRATLSGTVLFFGGMVPLWVVTWAAGRGSFGLGLPDELTWILAVVLLGGAVLTSFVGARTGGRGVDRLAVEAAREFAYRRSGRPDDRGDRRRDRPHGDRRTEQ